MKMIHKVLLSIFTLLFATLPLSTPTLAADIRGEDTIQISGETNKLDNPYLFGGQIDITSPVTNDIVTAGGNINLENAVTGSIWAAGGDIQIKSRVGNSIRVAGGNITIDGPIKEDLIVMGGSVRVTKNATVGGDLVFLGGQLRLDGPVKGYVLANGGEVTINAPVQGNVSGEMGKLTLGPNAKIGGNLSYTAEEKSEIDNSKVEGKVTYKKSEISERAKEGVGGLVAAGTIYKLIADILFILLLIWLFRPFITRVVETIDDTYLKSAGIGFAALVLTPLIGAVLLVIIWLGVSIFLIYGLLLILSTLLMKLFIGWKTLSWWEGKNNREYLLDWKAAVAGVLIVFILGLIPVLGWLAVFILFLLALGGLTQEVFALAETQREVVATKSSIKRKTKTSR